MRALWLCLAAALATGCSPLVPYREEADPGTFHLLEGVPFYAQEGVRDCGPAALASVLAYRGHPVPVEEVRAAVYDPRIGGSLLADMENFSRRLGLRTASGNGDLALLRTAVDAGQPIVALVDFGVLGLREPHYLVVYGYGPGSFVVHVGVAQAVRISDHRLDRTWARMNRLYLIVE